MKKILIFIFILIILAAAGAGFLYIRMQKNQIAYEAPFVKKTIGGFFDEKLPNSEPAKQYQKPDENKSFKFPVFNYHHIRPMPNVASSTITDRAFTVSPEGFEKHLQYFKDNGYQTVLIQDLLDYFDTGKPLPEKAIAITFDDGRYGQYKWAYQLLKQYGMKATFFITTKWVGGRDFLNWDEIKEMSQNGMAIGSHALTHPNLTTLSEELLTSELVASKRIIEEKIGLPITLLAYPGGNYNDKVIEIAKTVGYDAALGVYKIIDQAPKYRYSIRRFHADDDLESIVNKLVNY